MDDNTTKVVMAVIALVSAVVTPLVLVIVTRMQNKLITNNQAETKTALVAVTEKVEVYHKEVNGHMSKLLDTTKELATAQEKVRASNEDGPVLESGKTAKAEVRNDLDQAKEKIDIAKKKLGK